MLDADAVATSTDLSNDLWSQLSSHEALHRNPSNTVEALDMYLSVLHAEEVSASAGSAAPGVAPSAASAVARTFWLGLGATTGRLPYASRLVYHVDAELFPSLLAQGGIPTFEALLKKAHGCVARARLPRSCCAAPSRCSRAVRSLTCVSLSLSLCVGRRFFFVQGRVRRGERCAPRRPSQHSERHRDRIALARD
jgi:hypothetical protein